VNKHSLVKQLTNLLQTPAFSIPELLQQYPQHSFVIYGAGRAGSSVLQCLKQFNQKVLAVIDSNAHLLGSSLHTIPISTLDHCLLNPQQIEQAVVLICVTQNSAVMQQIYNQLTNYGFKHIVPWSQKAFSPEWHRRYQQTASNSDSESIVNCMELLLDSESQQTFYNVMNACHQGHFDNIPYLPAHEQYFPPDIVFHKGYQHFLDAGAFTGDTCKQLIEKKGIPRTYIAFEPDMRNFPALVNTVNQAMIKPSWLFPCGLADKTATQRLMTDQVFGGLGDYMDDHGDAIIQCVAIDDVIQGFIPTMLKMDIEGAEWPALFGAQQLIQQHAPDLAISIYHYFDHYFTIPLLLKQWVPDYQFFMRTYAAHGNETILYATCCNT
jgi:FkbM family methyltransferase